MLLNLSDVNAGLRRTAPACSGRSAWPSQREPLLAIGLVALFAGGSVQASESAGMIPAEGYDRIEYLGALLFSRYMIPFQASALLLLATMIGVLVLAKRRRDGDPEEVSQ